MNHWIFLGNPNVFPVNEIVTEHADKLYWSTGNFGKKILPGDHVFVWRSTVDPGVIAVGEVAGHPIEERNLPEDFPHEDTQNLKVPLRVREVRLSTADGMVTRDTVEQDVLLASASVVTANTGSVHRLTPDQASQLALLWSDHAGFAYPLDSDTEGARKLRAHYTRERSAKLRKRKLDETKSKNGALTCEICGATAPEWVHPAVGERMFEIHHREPISQKEGPVKTALADLAVLCANCHRMVHTSTSVAAMFNLLKDAHEDASELSAADHERATIHPRKLYEYRVFVGSSEYRGLAIGLRRTETGIVFHDTDRDRIFEGEVTQTPEAINVETDAIRATFWVVTIDRFYSYWISRIGGAIPMVPNTRTLHRWYYTQFISFTPWVEPAYT